MKKVIALVFGGRSPEHEISFLSARNVTAALNKDLFTPLLIGISKEGTWYELPGADIFNEIQSLSDRALPPRAAPISLICKGGRPHLLRLSNTATLASTIIDGAFPILHGAYGEDGTIQGLFKMVNLPFVGCGVFASAAGMDKEITKRLLENVGIPVARYRVLTPWNKKSYKELIDELGSPFFVKPTSLGSSVGVHKIKNAQEYEAKLQDALRYDYKILAEEAIQGREIECSVMGLSHQPKASLPGEVIPNHEFYSYEAKYVDDEGAALKIPAILKEEEITLIQETAKKVYQTIGCDGLTRVDFFLKKNGTAIVNEINTIPGFTKISMYPKMWESSGLNYSDLITELIQLAFKKYEMEQRLETSYQR